MGFIAAQTGHAAAKLHLDSRLLHDLGVDGDDGPELLQAFSDQYGVALDGVDMTRYFGPESSLGLIFFMRFFSSKREREESEKAPISIRDLVACAREKRWIL